MQTDCALAAIALVNDGDFVDETTIDSGLGSDPDLLTGWDVEPDEEGGGNGSFDSSPGTMRLEWSALSRFKEGNWSVLMISEEERIVNSVEGVGSVELHHEV